MFTKQPAQLTEEFAVRMRRFVGLALGVRVARELAQALAVGGRMQCDELAERVIALVDQAIAPGFDALHPGGFAVRLLAILGKRAADRFDLVVAELA